MINLVFPSKCDYTKLTDFFNTFDFSITKIYYSYESDSIYLPVEIMKPYGSMCLNLQQENDRIDVLSNIYSIEFYAMTTLVCDLLSTTNLFIRFKRHRSINSRNREFIRESHRQLSLLQSYFAVHFRRTMKYVFKDYFLNEIDKITVLKKIKLIHKMFGTLLYEKNRINELNLTTCFFEFINTNINDFNTIISSDEIDQVLTLSIIIKYKL